MLIVSNALQANFITCPTLSYSYSDMTFTIDYFFGSKVNKYFVCDWILKIINLYKCK